MSYQQISVDLDILESHHADLETKLPYYKLLKCWALVGKGWPPKFWIITCTTIWLCHCYYIFFSHLLILET